jgi:hypothetical protein
LHNIKQAEAYGHDQIYMVIVYGNIPAQDRMGELNFKDEDSTCIIIFCYVPNQSIKGYDNFVLISNDNSDDIRTDINYHSSMARHAEIVLLRKAEQTAISL